MQLIALILMLMLSGSGGYSQLKPIIEELGGEEAAGALKQAEEISQMISTVQALTSPTPKVDLCPDKKPVSEQPHVQPCHPLDPIKPIADERTLTALSQYIALGE